MADQDQRLFNCSEEHEINYVAGLYGPNAAKVRMFLKLACADGRIKRSTHAEVYELIEKELGYPIPVKNPRG